MDRITSGTAKAVLNPKPLVFLGAISYSTYLYQQVVIFPVREAMETIGAPLAVSFAGCVVAVWVVASLSHAFVEVPFLSKGRVSSQERVTKAVG